MARARAMHRRCCSPPERFDAATFSRFCDAVPQGGRLERRLGGLVEQRLLLDAVEAQSRDDVVVDRHRGKGVRALEDHADARAQFGDGDVAAVDVGALEQDLTR